MTFSDFYIISVMNRLLKIVIFFLLLSACAEKKTVTNTRCDVISAEKTNKLFEGYDRRPDEDGEYHIGTGVLLLKVEEDTVEDSDKKIYPVYLNEDIVFYALDNGENVDIIFSEKIAQRMKEGRFLIFEEKGEIFYLDENGVIAFANEEGPAVEKKGAALLKRNKGRFEKNPLGEEKMQIQRKGNKETDKEKVRISVKFTPGEEDEKIHMFEQFCDGRLHMKLKGSKVCVFEIKSIGLKALNKLIDDANGLDYVESASLDSQNELIDPVTKTE